MTTITTTCTGCGRQLAIPERYQGRDLRCPGCGRSFRVDPPAPPHAVEPVAPPATARAAEPAPAPASARAPATPSPAPSHARPEATGPFTELFTAPADAGAAPAKGAEEEAVEIGPVYWRLKRLGVLSTGLVSAVIYAALGLLVGIAVAVASFFLPAPAIPFVSPKLVGGLAVVTFPVLYGAMGFVVGALIALLYNLTARLVGGVRLLLE